MTEYRYEYGKRWDSRVPRTAIYWLMGQVRVSTPEDEVAADIRRRCTAPGYTPALIRQSVAYALICHQRNRDLYAHVIGTPIK